MYNTSQVLIRALRLPFITASVLPFIFGSVMAKGDFNIAGFMAGLICVIATHLAANLMNDYADSGTGADWHDKKFYGFFGGSKLIQEKVFPEGFYLKGAIFCASIATISAIILAVVLKNISVMVFYTVIIFLALSYSKEPFKFCYRKLGEVIIFILFGPAIVVGGYFIQTRTVFSTNAFFSSIPFGFMTTAILFANEVPDLQEDVRAGKFTWVSVIGGKNAYILYSLLIVFVFLFILLDVISGFIHPAALFSLIFAFLALKAGAVLKKHPDDKEKMIESSRLTILFHALVSIVLIIAGVL